MAPEGGIVDATLNRIDGACVVTVRDSWLDANTARDFKKQMADVVDDCPRVVLDLGRVEFIDSAGCGAVLTCLKKVNTVGGSLKVCGVNGQVRQVFDLLCMDRVLDLCASPESALKSLNETVPGPHAPERVGAAT